MVHATIWVAALAGILAADAPDPTVDWLMGQATTAPAAATRPEPAAVAATQPAAPTANSPLVGKTISDGARPATITLSTGQQVRGPVATTRDKPIRVHDPAKNEYRDIPYKLIRSIQAKVLWEREQPDWHFKASGSDVKEYTGRSYPNHELQYTVTLLNGQTVTGGIVAPLYLQTADGNEKLFVLHKRDKGEVGQTLKDLVYVQRVEFDAAQP